MMKTTREWIFQMVGIISAFVGVGELFEGLNVKLFDNDFTPTPGSTEADFNEASFDGYADIAPGVGNFNDGLDPVSGLVTLDPPTPAGGWRWETTGVTGFPLTIYGYYVTDINSLVVGYRRFDTPIVLTAIGQVIDLPETVRLRFNDDLIG